MSKKPHQINEKFRLAIAQLNPIIGDIEGNLAKARAARRQANENGADFIIFPAFFLSGWPIQDFGRNGSFVKKNQWAIDELAADTRDGGAAILVFFSQLYEGKTSDVIQLLDNGKMVRESSLGDMFMVRGLPVGVLWGARPPLKEQGAQFAFIFDRLAYQHDVAEYRLKWAKLDVEANGLPLVRINMVGGQDGLVFDGGSLGLQPSGAIAFQMPHFAENITIIEWEKTDSGWYCRNGEISEFYQGAAADYHACMLGLRDYVNKNGFDKVLLGLSGGVDSALCAALAVDALGADRVQTLMLPYHYTSQESLRDAQDCANSLGCAHQTISIAAPVEAFLDLLQPAFDDRPPDMTEENLQSRTRGVILMALSNKFGSLLLTTGNKSEAAVGYATLYGDMCGGFNPLKDLYKRDVYQLCDWRNKNMVNGGLGPKGQVIPQNILDRPPSAELRPDQKDEDSLPPYPVLDTILHSLIEENTTVASLVSRGYERSLVERVEELLYRGEFKRQQAAPGVKLSTRSFGHDWHVPITHHFRDKI